MTEAIVVQTTKTDTTENPNNDSTDTFLNASRGQEVLQGEELPIDDKEKQGRERCCGCCYVQPEPDEDCTSSFGACLSWLCACVCDFVQCYYIDNTHCIWDCCKACGKCACDLLGSK